jgi:hypothetical protein
MFKEIVGVYNENETKPINTIYGQNAELQNVNPLKTSGDYMYHLLYQLVTLHFVFMGQCKHRSFP